MAALRNGLVRVSIIDGSLGQKIGTAGDIRGMKEAVIFRGVIGLQICAQDPILHGVPIHDPCIVRVRFCAKRVHHVFQGSPKIFRRCRRCSLTDSS